MGVPIAPGVWTDDAAPRLIGGRDKRTGRIVFPVPDGAAGIDYDPVRLSRDGVLWSWTVQRFRPKSPPYQGPEVFVPFTVGYVELPGEVIVEARLTGAAAAAPVVGMRLKLAIVPFDDHRDTFAFEEAA